MSPKLMQNMKWAEVSSHRVNANEAFQYRAVLYTTVQYLLEFGVDLGEHGRGLLTAHH